MFVCVARLAFRFVSAFHTVNKRTKNPPLSAFLALLCVSARPLLTALRPPKSKCPLLAAAAPSDLPTEAALAHAALARTTASLYTFRAPNSPTPLLRLLHIRSPVPVSRWKIHASAAALLASTPPHTLRVEALHATDADAARREFELDPDQWLDIAAPSHHGAPKCPIRDASRTLRYALRLLPAAIPAQPDSNGSTSDTSCTTTTATQADPAPKPEWVLHLIFAASGELAAVVPLKTLAGKFNHADMDPDTASGVPYAVTEYLEIIPADA